jgi:hypothetical protein
VYYGVKQKIIIHPMWLRLCFGGFEHELEDDKVGCFIGEFFVRALAFADDLT